MNIKNNMGPVKNRYRLRFQVIKTYQVNLILSKEEAFRIHSKQLGMKVNEEALREIMEKSADMQNPEETKVIISPISLNKTN
jgi:hypothetical protein